MTEASKPGQVLVGDKVYMQDAKGGLVPIALVKDEHRLQDDLVRELFAKAEAVHDELKAFKLHAFTEVQAFLDMISEKYGAKARPGGEKGNVTLQTYDGSLRVQLQVADLVRFDDAGLQACKQLVQEYLAEATTDSSDELRAILMNAFRMDASGQVNRGALLGLLRLEFKDARLVGAMKALRDAIRPDGTKPYVRFHARSGPDKGWETLSLDLATV